MEVARVDGPPPEASAAPPRVAFFPDVFHEVSGQARSSRSLVEFALRRGYPLLCVRAGDRVAARTEGSVTTLTLPRGFAAFPVESDQSFDPLLWRHLGRAEAEARRFAPDLVHVTTPGDFGMLGARVAVKLGVPLVASWHTNLHEYAALRLGRLLEPLLPAGPRRAVCRLAERVSLALCLRFYGLARLVFAPTEELGEMLARATRRPVRRMRRGIDLGRFSPAHRRRHDQACVLGFVGRLSTEKDVRFLARVEAALEAAEVGPFRILVVGTGAEAEWLARNLKHGDLRGLLRGEDLARAYAEMDVFLFPSKSDTFGMVVLEALASGVPAVVTAWGGPRTIVEDGLSGWVAADDQAFLSAAVAAARSPDERRRRGLAGRERARAYDWDDVFAQVWAGYRLVGRRGEGCAEPRPDPAPAPRLGEAGLGR